MELSDEKLKELLHSSLTVETSPDFNGRIMDQIYQSEIENPKLIGSYGKVFIGFVSILIISLVTTYHGLFKWSSSLENAFQNWEPLGDLFTDKVVNVFSHGDSYMAVITCIFLCFAILMLVSINIRREFSL